MRVPVIAPAAAVRIISFVLCLYLCAGCAAATGEADAVSVTSPSQVATSLWSGIYELDRVQQSEAPAMTVTHDRITFAWPSGNALYARTQQEAEWGETVRLQLPVLNPHTLTMLPAMGQGQHLLWLDTWPQPDGSFQQRLLTAYWTSDFQIERGSIPVSALPTLHYSAISNPDGSAWVVWSGGLPEQPGLYVSFVDPVGRPRQPSRLTSDGDWPVLVLSNDGVLHLYWLRRSGVYHARLEDEQLIDPVRLTDSIDLELTDWLTSFSVGIDQTHIYLFWNVFRGALQTAEVWMSAGMSSAADNWSSPQLLGRGESGVSVAATGFNSGRTTRMPPNRATFAAVPLRGQYETLPVALYRRNTVAIVYFQSGEVAAYQDVATWDTPATFELPAIATDINRHLYLTWVHLPAEPNEAASLRFTATRH